MPEPTGCSADALQRQRPFSVFWNGKAFSIRRRTVTGKLSLLVGDDGPALPVFRSQHVPVQLDAIELQAAKGESTTISIPTVTSAFWFATWLSSSNTRLTLKKSPQEFFAWICETQRSTESAFGRDAGRSRPKTRFGSPLAASIPAVISFRKSSRQSCDGANSASGTLSLPARLHLRSRFLIHLAYSAKASCASSSFSLPISARTSPLSSVSPSASVGSLQISEPAAVLAARQSKLGSCRVAILSSISSRRHAFTRSKSSGRTGSRPKTPQLLLRSLIHSAFSSIAIRRSARRLKRSWIAALSFSAAAARSRSPQSNWLAGSRCLSQ